MIQIKDMEMPKNCQWDCPFCAGDGGACLVADVKTSDTERPKDCPLLSAEPCRDASVVVGEITLHNGHENIIKILQDIGYLVICAGEKFDETRHLIYTDTKRFKVEPQESEE